jgi:stage III sporulation protein AG
MNGFAEKIKIAVVKNKKLSAFLILILVIIFLFTFSDKKEKVQTVAELKVSDSQYCAELEEKIKNIVTAITSDKDCIVAVTLESGSEYVYADQNKTDTDLTRENGDKTATKESETKEQEYIIVKSNDGSETALIITEKKPSIRGVAIVSSGITETKEASVLNAVSSVLGISSRKISITNKS